VLGKKRPLQKRPASRQSAEVIRQLGRNPGPPEKVRKLNPPVLGYEAMPPEVGYSAKVGGPAVQNANYEKYTKGTSKNC